jgi:hypothetical protein
MKLYYIIEKCHTDKFGIMVPLFYTSDVKDTEFNETISLNLFYQFDTFDENVLEEYNEKKSLNDYFRFDIRVFSMYSIETENLAKKFTLTKENEYKYKLTMLNENVNWVEHIENHSYASDFQNLDWKLEKVMCVNKNKFKSKFKFNETNDNEIHDIEKLIDIIVSGDSPERLLRLNNIVNDFNCDTQKCAKELYEILYDFTYGDYFDINAEGSYYYAAMAFLRKRFNTDPNYK